MLKLFLRSFSSYKHSKELLEDLTYYELLNVKPNSSKSEIRKAYLSLARKHHPDLQINPSLEFTYINKAYQTLMDDYEKAKYDDSLKDDKDYYKIGTGKFSLSLKYVFLMSFGMFILVLASESDREEVQPCPTNGKMKKLETQLADQETPELPEQDQETIWQKKKSSKPEELLFTQPKKKGIFSDKPL